MMANEKRLIDANELVKNFLNGLLIFFLALAAFGAIGKLVLVIIEIAMRV